MSDICVRVTSSGAPANGLTDDPEITIERADTGAAVVSGAAMTDQGANGLYTFAFTPTRGLNYCFIIDADPNDTGQTDRRYYDGAFNNEGNDVWRDRGLDPASPKTVDDNGVADDADIDEDVAASGNDPLIHKDTVTVGNVTTITGS